MSYRFRTEGDLLVLQVMEPMINHGFGFRDAATWRDAKVQDIPVNDPFSRVEYVHVPVPPPGQSFD